MDTDLLGTGTNDLRGGFHLPLKMLENERLSETSQAHICFLEQKFSANLQAFLVDYVISISGPQAVYA